MTGPSESQTQSERSPVHPLGTSGERPALDSTGPEARPDGRAALTRSQLEAVRARDPEALGALFETYFDRVYGLIRRLMRDPVLAEDVTQEVFLKVHRAAHRIDPERDPGPWLMTIAYNACRDVWRSSAYRLAARATPIDSPEGVTLSRGTNDPERDLLTSERDRIVQEAIAALPEPLRVAVLLHDYEGLGHEEIAAVLGVQHAAARKRYSRALAALAKSLEGRLG